MTKCAVAAASLKTANTTCHPMRISLTLLAAVPAVLAWHPVVAQHRPLGYDGTDLLRGQHLLHADSGAAPTPLHDVRHTATNFAVWNFAEMKYDTIRFLQRRVPNGNPDGWGRFVRLWVEEAELANGNLTESVVDSLAAQFGDELAWITSLAYRPGRGVNHAALDSTLGTDILLLDIRDGYDSAQDTTWISGYMDKCDSKKWVPAACPRVGGGNQGNILYLDTYPHMQEDMQSVGAVGAWLYGRRYSSVFGPKKLLMLEYGSAQWFQGVYDSAYGYYLHPNMCTEYQAARHAQSMPLDALLPYPEGTNTTDLQIRGALFVGYVSNIDLTHPVNRADEHGNFIQEFAITTIMHSTAPGWAVIDTIISQWNRTPPDSMLRWWPRSIPWTPPPEGLATRDDLVFSFHEATFRGYRSGSPWAAPRRRICPPYMDRIPSNDPARQGTVKLSRGTAQYVDLSGLTDPYTFSLEVAPAAGGVPVQASAIYFENGDTLMLRFGWLDPDSAAAWPWSLPDTIAAKQVAGLVLVAGTVGEPVSLDSTIGVPVAAARIPPPPAFTLDQNYPNPFSKGATVQYSLTHPGPVKLEVYDLLGRCVAVLAEGARASGAHQVRIDAQAWASAVYLLRLSTPHGASTRRMVLAR